MMSNDIIVIGGGAAGLFAAITAAKLGRRVAIIEPNDRLGKKINITGKGRCNVTNNCLPNELMDNIPRNSKFLFASFASFNAQDTMRFFENAGVKLKTERGNRVFPVSDCAFDISNALIRQCKLNNVTWIHDRAEKIIINNSLVESVKGEKDIYQCDKVILATGGMSYPGTGSTGDGYRIAEELGHHIVEPHGSLVPLNSSSKECSDMQGLSLKNVKLTLMNSKNKKIYEEIGEMLFTHFGVSGPLVLSSSAHVHDWNKDKYYISLDLKPALDEQKLDLRIQRDIAENPNRSIETLIQGLVPKSMVPVLVRKLNVEHNLHVNSLKREQRLEMINVLKHFKIPITGPRDVKDAIITSGGISIKEISPSTLESKIIKNVYFAGEVIDVDAYTGGFNLQIAWSTGYLAGRSAAENEVII